MKSPQAYIHPNAKIAEDVIVEPFAMIHGDVEIGSGTWIGSHAVVNDGARIGKNCYVFPGAVISAIPQDLKFNNEYTLTTIGDNTTVREYATISRGTEEHWKTEIGTDCLIMAYAHIAHDCRIGNHCILGNNVQMAGHVQVGDWAIISAISAVHQFTKIGIHSFVSGGALVRKDVPPYTKAAREPIAYVGINSVGLRRRGYSDTQIAEIQNIYRYVYMRGLNNSEALSRIEMELQPSKERDEIVNFIRSSERGIMRSPLSSDGALEF